MVKDLGGETYKKQLRSPGLFCPEKRKENSWWTTAPHEESRAVLASSPQRPLIETNGSSDSISLDIRKRFFSRG